jgi:hypothetical protein
MTNEIKLSELLNNMDKTLIGKLKLTLLDALDVSLVEEQCLVCADIKTTLDKIDVRG